MEVRLFGELEALDGGVPVPVHGAKQRALLALLALQRGQPVSADRLIDVLWGDGRAANPANALQAQIGQLRRTLGPAAILATDAGYALTAGPRRGRRRALRAAGRERTAAGCRRRDGAGVGRSGRGPRPAARRAAGRVHFMQAFLMPNGPRLDELTLVATESRAGR